ncbi:endolytic transglycosylase MltG [Vibrio tapetis subsp. quintayensis]|uniref:endolytic transglycosylase MltG n=1 Tax=Vibrio tapetis TaxID=52443 RepID=UPI0025B325CC|nr:endolytic transglycosylase MltG [Vibrio tapetis]MDN3682320.1 endolytic transglycosylase MltG [Vibrio tapetis subsp. quintayensis]
MIKKILLLALILTVMALGGAFYVHQQVEQYVNQPVNIEEPTLITVKPGTSFGGLLSQLENSGWVKASSYSRLVPKLYPELVKVKAGTFELPENLNLSQALQALADGKEYQFTITFIEGSRFSEWLEQLSEADYLEQTLSTMTEAEIAQSLGIETAKLEGQFLAETYHYPAGTSDLDVLKWANKSLTQVLNKAWEQRKQPLPLKTPYEALILASIIEKETAIDEERERVSSVFINRLNRPMRLQTDPTVIYGMGDKYKGNIRKKDLRTPTPYNTYTINGLPPTPIAMAGKASIDAALNPEKSNYLYFVASGHGGHVFSKSLTEHNRAVRAYLKVLRSKK